MTDTEAAATQADADDQSQADTTSDQSQADQSISLAEAKKLRAEANSLRQRLRIAEQKAEAAANAGKSDEEQRQARLAAAEARAEALEAQLRSTTARIAVSERARKAGAISPNAVYALIRDDLEFDDDGDATNIADAIAQLRKDEPSLFRAAAGDGDGGRRGPNSGDDMNSTIRRMAGRTS